jgi:hypothetical protein
MSDVNVIMDMPDNLNPNPSVRNRYTNLLLQLSPGTVFQNSKIKRAQFFKKGAMGVMS